MKVNGRVASLVQLIERRICTALVGGLNPSRGSNGFPVPFHNTGCTIFHRFDLVNIKSHRP
jgi:hypothetical protein